MKKSLLVCAFALTATSAFAQSDAANERKSPSPNSTAPSYQQGSGDQSGGYARELNTETGKSSMGGSSTGSSSMGTSTGMPSNRTNTTGSTGMTNDSAASPGNPNNKREPSATNSYGGRSGQESGGYTGGGSSGSTSGTGR